LGYWEGWAGVVLLLYIFMCVEICMKMLKENDHG